VNGGMSTSIPASSGADMAIRIAVFEPDIERAAAIALAISCTGRQIVAMGDPALSVRDWVRTAFDIALISPVQSAGAQVDVVTLCRRIAAGRPLMVLTSNICAEERTRAIAAGADDAIEPLGAPRELAIRIDALLRRRAATLGRLACDDLEIDLIRRAVRRGPRNIHLPAREFELLAELARTPGEIVPRAQLLRTVWRLDFDPGTNRVEVHMSRLRGRIDCGEHFPMLRTIKGRGYALVSRNSLFAEALLHPA
jgi:two-component system, OmpR family, response regulator